MQTKFKVLVIDDEFAIRKMLEISLKNSGYDVLTAETGKSGISIAASHPPSAVILDIGLPDINGLEVLRQLRAWYSGPIIMLSVQNGESDIIAALDIGANDYLAKPYRTGELLARLRSSIRLNNSSTNTLAIDINSVHINIPDRLVKKDGKSIKLTTTEFDLLAIMVKNAGRVLTHQYLLKEVWGPSFIDQSQYLRVYVAQLRRKLEENVNRPTLIVTESGVGYRFVIDN